MGECYESGGMRGDWRELSEETEGTRGKKNNGMRKRRWLDWIGWQGLEAKILIGKGDLIS